MEPKGGREYEEMKKKKGFKKNKGRREEGQ